ncbi:TetR/AcrR family transcriptional regulator [Actibacterium sp. D379-3]
MRGRPRKDYRWSDEALDRDTQFELRREALVRTAAREFSRKGYYTTSVDALARLLNVTKPTLYHYIKDKDEILFECQRHAFMMIEPAIRDAEQSDAPGLEKLQAFLPHLAKMITSEFGTCLLKTGLAPLKPQSREKLEIFARQLDDTMMNIIQCGIEDGSIRACNPRLTAFAILSGFNGLASWYDHDGPLSPEDVARTFADLYTGGLLAPEKLP